MAWLFRLLRAQKTGIWCAGVSVVLMGFGSVWMDIVPQHYVGLHADDLRFFIDPLHPAHFWLYGLAATLALWAFSAAVCTWDAVLSRIRLRRWHPTAWGTPLVHISFVGALIMHLWGGLSSSETMHSVGPEGADVHGERYAFVDLNYESWPSGMPKLVEATLRRERDGRTEDLTLGYNDPIVLHGGATVLLLAGIERRWRGVFARAGERVELGPGESAMVGGQPLQVDDVVYGRGLRMPVAQVRGSDGRQVLLGMGMPARAGLSLVDASPTQVVAIKERHNPGFPLTLALSALVALGALLIGWSRVRMRRA